MLNKRRMTLFNSPVRQQQIRKPHDSEAEEDTPFVRNFIFFNYFVRKKNLK